jgi:hypothetical protein
MGGKMTIEMVWYMVFVVWTLLVGFHFWNLGSVYTYNSLMRLIRDARKDPERLEEVLNILSQGIDKQQ